MAEAVRHRNAVGWSILQDKAVGLSVGVPTKLVKMAATRTMNGGTIYDFDGKVGFVLGIRYGDFTCSNFGSYYAWVQRRLFTKTTWKAMSYDTFAVFEKKNGQQTYFQATCRTSGVAFASISMTDTQAKSYGELFGALADSLIVSRELQSDRRAASPRSTRTNRAKARTCRPTSSRPPASRRSCRPMSTARARPRASSCRRATATISRRARCSTRCRARSTS